MAIVELPDHGLSNTKARTHKHWVKQLTSVDRSSSTGYAFLGGFHKFGATVEAPEGAWFLSYIEDKSGSGHLYGRVVVLYQVRGDQLKKVEEWSLDGADGWALRCRDQIADLMARETLDPEALQAERAKLVARIAEIDKLLEGVGSA